MRDKRGVNRRLLLLGRALVACAALSICGGHWAVLQSVAWANMLVENARGGDFRVAVSRTFDGAHPCALCEEIHKGRKSEQKTEGQLSALKLNLFHEALAEGVWAPPRSTGQWESREAGAEARPAQPRLEPPRAVRA